MRRWKKNVKENQENMRLNSVNWRTSKTRCMKNICRYAHIRMGFYVF